MAQTLPDPGVSGLTQSEIDRRSQAQAEAVIGAAVLAHFAGRAGALRDFPVLRQIFGDTGAGTVDEDPQAAAETAAWLSACAALGGGYGAEPGDEHHGGYTFCAAAALVLLGHSAAVDAPRLRRWVAMRQMPEGGFSGRAHKLVDACYAW